MSFEELKYPIKFTPILKQKIWGGSRIVEDLNKRSELINIGESWEISGVKNYVSKVANGCLKGRTLTELIKTYKGKLLGEKIYSRHKNEFPLLFKFIDAADNLSIQLHPNDELAKERHDSFGKTEMWYVLGVERNSNLYVGFNQELNKKECLKYFQEGGILDIIQANEVEKGDVYFIEAGTIHAIGKGVLIVEIQQTSDITYRVYDWGRVNSEGEGRELHVDLAIEALVFNKEGSYRGNYNNHEEGTNLVCDCKYFTVNKINIRKELKRKLSKPDSFIVYMCVGGSGFINIEEKTEEFKYGETILIPAISTEIYFQNKDTNSSMEVLEIYIN